MKIYLDDVRDCPDGYILCRTAEEAIEYIKTGKVKFISFDHDLGEVPLSGYDIVGAFIHLTLLEESESNKL